MTTVASDERERQAERIAQALAYARQLSEHERVIARAAVRYIEASNFDEIRELAQRAT